MVDQSQDEGDYTKIGAITFAHLIPYFFALGSFGYIIWSFANEQSSMISNQAYMSNEISQIERQEDAQQTLLTTLSSQLAEVQQSVDDMRQGVPEKSGQ